MISRRSAKLIADLYEGKFTSTKYSDWGDPTTKVHYNKLYDFLYENNYPAWLCNMAKKLIYIRSIKEWIMRLHTGETVSEATQSWSWQQREELGRRYLCNLAENWLHFYDAIKSGAGSKKLYESKTEEMLKSLELDGYMYRNSILLASESDVLDVKEEESVLKALFTSLGLANEETTFHHLELSEKHYIDGKWDDSISNSRKFLECVLSEVTAKHSKKVRDRDLASSILEKPVKVRDYLEREGLLENKEKEALAKVYGLLSATGGHPYMAQNNQARLLRHLALTFCQFVMLRLDGRLKSAP